MSTQANTAIDKGRLETFVDAILAIIVTILVLDFKVPHIEHATSADLKEVLIELLPQSLSYLISFLTIAALWIDHQYLFKNITHTDKKFALLNLLFLLCLSPLPFTTSLAGHYIQISFAVAIVAVNYFMMNLGFGFLYLYAIKKGLLPENVTSDPLAKKAGIISTVGFFLLFASVPLAYVNTYIPFSIFLAVTIAHLLKK